MLSSGWNSEVRDDYKAVKRGEMTTLILTEMEQHLQDQACVTHSW